MDPQLDTDERSSKRARSAIACHRCKQRKQRCDNGFPSCANCIAARHACSYDANVYPANHVRTLESRIADLEARLAVEPAAPQGTAVDAPPSRAAQMIPDGQGHHHQAQDLVSDHSMETFRVTQHLELEAGFVPLSPDAYLGTSSGFPLAKVVQSACNASFLGVLQNGPSQDATTDRPDRHLGLGLGTQGNAALDSDRRRETACRKATMPKKMLGERLVRAYLTKVHPKHPFLSPRRIRQLHERRATLRPCAQLTAGKAAEERLDYFILHMVYAIGARYLQLVGDYGHSSPEEHYAAAVDDIDTVFDIRTIENLEGMLLLVIYQLRSPSGPGIWSIIGVTMRHCLACGLHRKSNLPHLLDQRRKRIFWTAYMLERSIARTLGRPYCVTDREIDIDLPANVDDDIDNEADMIEAIEESARHPGRVTSMSPAICIFRVQQLESKIHSTIYRVDRPTVPIASPKVVRLRNALEDWRRQIPRSVPQGDDSVAPNAYTLSSYHVLQYHKAMLLLLLPLLPSLPPTHPDFRLCADTAGQICQAYKHLHDDQPYLSYSLLALHANFVAGLTMVYCFLADNSTFDFKLSSDIRACSTVLYIIAERWPTARKVRNAFERLVRVTVEGDVDARRKVNQPQPQVPSVPLRTQPDFALADQHIPVGMYGLGEFETQPESSDVWNILGSVLEDEEVNWRWTQDGLYNAVGVFPDYE